MTGDLHQKSRNKDWKAPTQSSDRLEVLNFFENQIKVNSDAVVEIRRMR